MPSQKLRAVQKSAPGQFDAYLYKSSYWPFQNRHHSHRRSLLLHRYMLRSCRDPGHSHLSLKIKKDKSITCIFRYFHVSFRQAGSAGSGDVGGTRGGSGFC